MENKLLYTYGDTNQFKIDKFIVQNTKDLNF